MASHHRQIRRMKTASEAGWVRSFIVFRERHLKCGADFVTFSAAVWAPGRFRQSSRRNDERGKRAGRPARRTGRLSGGWQCSRIQMDYQSCIRWQELKWDTVPVVRSLSPSPHSRPGLVGSWHTHTSVSHGALVSPQPHTMTVSPDRPISRSSSLLISPLPSSPSSESSSWRRGM